MRILVLAVLLSGCGAGALTIANGSALGLSTATLACDWGQTRKGAEAGWGNQIERNPIMGTNPPTHTVDAYFLAALALNAAAWHLMPRRWKMVIPIVVTLTQVKAINHNLDAREPDLGMCGI